MCLAWIRTLLSSGKTVILLNGVPGDRIQCKDGLGQGDPLTPYLFIIVVDLLQCMISGAYSESILCHPLHTNLSPIVIQYVDDTLIVAQASEEGAITLRYILDDFALATGLYLNFEKNTFVPLNATDTTAASIAKTFGCPVSCFPQIYLGLRSLT